MKITNCDNFGFVDVCCKAANVGEVEIVKTIRERLIADQICVTDDPPGRVGNAGIGTIFRFKLKPKGKVK